MHRMALLLAVGLSAMVPASALAGPTPAPVDGGAPPARSDEPLEARRVRLLAGLKPGVRAKLDAPIQEVLRRAQPPVPVPGAPPPAEVDLRLVARTSIYQALGPMGDADIEALIFLVMMECSKSAQEDLKSMLDGLKAANAEKKAALAAQAALRVSREGTKSTKACATFVCLDTLAPSTEYTKADLDAVKRALVTVPEDKREASLRETSDGVARRIVALEDRKTKAAATLANILKRLNEPGTTMTRQNTK